MSAGYVKPATTPGRAEARERLLSEQRARAKLLLEAQKKADLEHAALRGPFPGLHEEVFDELTREERRAIERDTKEKSAAEDHAEWQEVMSFRDAHGAKFRAASLWLRSVLHVAASIAYDEFRNHRGPDDEKIDAEAPAVVIPIAQMLARRLVDLGMPEPGTAGGGQ